MWGPHTAARPEETLLTPARPITQFIEGGWKEIDPKMANDQREIDYIEKSVGRRATPAHTVSVSSVSVRGIISEDGRRKEWSGW